MGADLLHVPRPVWYGARCSLTRWRSAAAVPVSALLDLKLLAQQIREHVSFAESVYVVDLVGRAPRMALQRQELRHHP